jgi:preprotein translocase subunit SecE
MQKLPTAKTDNQKKMNKIKLYLQESYTELVNKVSWPTWAQLQSSAIVVMVASLIFAGVIFVMDFGFRNIMTTIYNLLY